MTIDTEKLRQFAATLTDDQTRLLREGLAGGDKLTPESLVSIFKSRENHRLLKKSFGEGGAPIFGGASEPGLSRW